MKSMPDIVKKLLLCAACTLFSFTVFAQVTLRSGFIPDSVVIGDEAAYYLTATYPKKLQLLFPDSTFSFHPFEFQRRHYFTTQTTDSISYDSTVYFLSTFEVDLVQSLQLPAFILHQQDCTLVLASRDSVFLKELVTQALPDTLQAANLPLVSNTAYVPVDWLLNYPLLSYVVVGLLVLLFVVWLVFGKRIRKHFMVKRLQKQHAEFVKTYSEQADLLKQRFSPTQTERLLSLWKYYMESLDTTPYTKLTTKETARLLQNTTLGQQLRTVDAAVYGSNQQVEEPILHLKEHAIKTFQQKLEQVAHG